MPERLRRVATRARYHSLMINDPETGRRLKELAEELEAKAERLEAESDRRTSLTDEHQVIGYRK